VNQYTLVRHSAYAVGGNPDFESAVELLELNTHQAYRVRAAGGLVFDTLAAAAHGAATANFPTGATRTAPNASGYFSSLRIGGAELYLPRSPPGNDRSGSLPLSRNE
jgi:hypothetical protein